MTSKNNARNNPATTVPDSRALVAAINGFSREQAYPFERSPRC